MGWSDVAGFISKAAPMVGTMIGGPVGGLAGGAISMVAKALGVEETPDAILTELKNNPDALVKVKELEAQIKIANIDAAKAERAADSEDLETVNITMRDEGKSEHWPQWSWRPYNGFMFGTTLFCVYFLLPILEKPVPKIDISTWVIWGSVLGVTAWGRNTLKQVQAGNKPMSLINGLAKRLGGK